MSDPRWLCEECARTCTDDEVLRAPDPFTTDGTLTACPHCRTAEQLVRACDLAGCGRRGCCGTPTPAGYRLLRAERDVLAAQLAAARADAERLVAELANIARANWRKWDAPMNTAEDLVEWAQSRARAAIDAAKGGA